MNNDNFQENKISDQELNNKQILQKNNKNNKINEEILQNTQNYNQNKNVYEILQNKKNISDNIIKPLMCENE